MSLAQGSQLYTSSVLDPDRGLDPDSMKSLDPDPDPDPGAVFRIRIWIRMVRIDFALLDPYLDPYW
jgi:hypothetical protein